MTLRLERTKGGQTASFDVIDVGIPAGTYRLRFSWRAADASRTRAGTAKVRFYAPSREGPASNPWQRLENPGEFKPVNQSSREQSEVFAGVTRGDADRIAVGSNWDQARTMPFYVSNNGGASWSSPLQIPSTIDVRTGPDEVGANVCCDPMAAADDQGNIWLGGLTIEDDPGDPPSRVIVNRLAEPSGTTFQPKTVGLDSGGGGGEDKPMITIDNDSSSPTYGRLYIVWNHATNSGAIRIEMSQCDTQLGAATPASCDDPTKWSPPTNVTGTTAGSYIYADAAVAPDGKVYVTWWDFSNVNAIRGDVCDPNAVNCTLAANWSGGAAVKNIALLDKTGSLPVPFQCPIVAQPGGRDAPEPQIAIDSSGGANDGRVYVTWGDLRAGSGTTRCNDTTQGKVSHLRWDSFVASANGALPGGSSASSTVGTRLISDSEGASGTDDWFPSVAVDQTNGQAWAALYSTREDGTRRKANYYARSVTPSGGSHSLGVLTKVSAQPSDYSGPNSCSDECPFLDFLNDYGDYAGIAATDGVAYPIWTDNSGGDGDPATFVADPGAPTVVTQPATSVTTAGATLHATINPNGSATSYRFLFGTSPGGQTHATPLKSAGAGSSNVAVSEPVNGLQPGHAYYVHVVASNANGTSNWTERAFATGPVVPTVSTGGATSVGVQTATLHGSVNPNNRLTTRRFEFGRTTAYGSSTASSTVGSGFGALPVAAGIGSLTPGTTYHYRLVATNAVGTRAGADDVFKTAPDTGKPRTRVRRVRCKRRRCVITIRATDSLSKIKSLRVRVKGKSRRCRRIAGTRACKTRRVNKRVKARRASGNDYRAKVKLRAGRYTVRTFATDAAGNRSKTAKKKFRVR